MKVYLIGPDGYFSQELELEAGEPIPEKATWIEPPSEEGDWFWGGPARGWVERARVEDEIIPDPEPAPVSVAKRLVSKSLWLEQLYLEEVVTLATLRMEAAEALKTAPAVLRDYKLRYFAAFLEHFSNLGDYIDLESQKVLEGLELFRDLADMTTERMFELLEYGL